MTTWKTITFRQSGSDGAEIFTFSSKDWRTCIFCCCHICRKGFNCTIHISHWEQSLFRRMGFKKRMRTTGKVEIPEGARKEAELLYLHNIVTIVEKYEIPHSLIMNLDQTPLKYIPAMNHTMAKQNSKSVSIAGSSDKRSITGTFTITLNGHFLPMQLIYGEKTKQSLPRFKFPMVSR